MCSVGASGFAVIDRGKILYDYGFVNMYMFTLVLLLFVQDCFSFLYVMNEGVVFLDKLANVNNLWSLVSTLKSTVRASTLSTRHGCH